MQLVKTHFTIVLPWILLIVGLISLTIGSFVEFDNPSWGKYFSSIGSSILASGIFALILKTIQFMGVFKEELNSIIFETKFLKNRADLPQYWEKVTKELVKDKFPHIHSAIMKDVKEAYLPTSLIHYYDNCSNIIDIEMIDDVKELVKVKHKNTFTIIPSEPGLAFEHPFWNRIVCPKDCPDSSCTITSVKVNDKSQDVKVNQIYDGNSIITDFKIPLSGQKGGYKIEIDSLKTYLLKNDNIIGYSNGYIQNNFKVQLFLSGVKAKFHDSGTLSNFKTITSKDTFIEKLYTGLIYKGQGYIVYLEKK